MACIKLDILNQYYLPADFKISKPKLSTFNFSLSTKKELTSKRSDFLACRAYLFGFNGMEKDPEITGQEGSHYTAAFWEYDTRIARRWNVDPVTRPWESPYAAFANNPIYYTDIEGNSASEFQDGGKNRTKRFERKYYKKQRESNLSPEEFYEKYKDKRWFKKYHETHRSNTTNWEISTSELQNESKPQIIQFSENSSANRLEDVENPSGTMTVEYDMATEADELVIKDANSGEVLYSLKSASK